MKKSFALILAMSLVVGLLAVSGCAKDEGAVKMGLGITTSIDKSSDATEDSNAQAQVDTTFAAVSFDAEGNIVGVQIDVAQVRVAFDEDMQVTNRDAALKTKKELGDDYNMRGQSEIGKEWFEQIAAFEEWMIGKNIDDVLNMDVKERDASHTHVPDVEELTSSVTITVQDYLKAVEKAWENAIEVEGLKTLGLGHDLSIASSTDATEDSNAQAQVDATIAATGFDGDGKVVGTIIDTAQTRVAYDEDGKVSNRDAALKTKKELGDDYNMKGRSEIGKEWFEQMAAFEEWMVGKTIDEITGLEVQERDASHTHVPAVEELTSSVTITVEGYLNAVEKASANAE